jgi:hypothetical protein
MPANMAPTKVSTEALAAGSEVKAGPGQKPPPKPKPTAAAGPAAAAAPEMVGGLIPGAMENLNQAIVQPAKSLYGGILGAAAGAYDGAVNATSEHVMPMLFGRPRNVVEQERQATEANKARLIPGYTPQN